MTAQPNPGTTPSHCLTKTAGTLAHAGFDEGFFFSVLMFVFFFDGDEDGGGGEKFVVVFCFVVIAVFVLEIFLA